MSGKQCILFTAFEPSGDALAASMITALKQFNPKLEVWAMGGPKMQAAGAQLLEQTTDNATMLLGVASQIPAHRRRLRRLTRWLADHDLTALVPVDSPAANWSICKRVRRAQPKAKIIHLAAPQLWAWAPWRIKKLRRLTDHVLCLLPFEPDWFSSRGVPATFVGHPLFDPPPDLRKPTHATASLLKNTKPKIAFLPGSRPSEIQANLPTILKVFSALKWRHKEMHGAIAVGDKPPRT